MPALSAGRETIADREPRRRIFTRRIASSTDGYRREGLGRGGGLGLELVDEVDDIEVSGFSAGPDAAASDGYGDVALTRAADEDDVALGVEGRTSTQRAAKPLQ